MGKKKEKLKNKYEFISLAFGFIICIICVFYIKKIHYIPNSYNFEYVGELANIEEKEPEIFDDYPSKITIEDAAKSFNAKYLPSGVVYDRGLKNKLKAGSVMFFGSLKKMPSQLQMALGQAEYALGQPIDFDSHNRQAVFEALKEIGLAPNGDEIPYGNKDLSISGKLRKRGLYNIQTANRNLETLNREIEKYKNDEKEKIKKEILYVVETTNPKIAIQRVKKIDNEQLKVYFDYTIRSIMTSIQNYSKDTGLEGIMTTENEGWINSRKGVEKLYHRGKDIYVKVSSLDIKKDIKNIVYEVLIKYKNLCRVNKTENCMDVNKLPKNYIVDNNIIKAFEAKRDLIMYYEFPIVECLYNNYGSEKCNILIDDYYKKGFEVTDTITKLQQSTQQRIYNNIKSF